MSETDPKSQPNLKEVFTDLLKDIEPEALIKKAKLIYYLFSDPKVDKWAKIAPAVGAILAFSVPLLIPDKLPLGLADNIALALFSLGLITHLANADIVKAHMEKVEIDSAKRQPPPNPVPTTG